MVPNCAKHHIHNFQPRTLPELLPSQIPTNTPRDSMLKRKRPFPRRFNVKYTWLFVNKTQAEFEVESNLDSWSRMRSATLHHTWVHDLK